MFLGMLRGHSRAELMTGREVIAYLLTWLSVLYVAAWATAAAASSLRPRNGAYLYKIQYLEGRYRMAHFWY